MLIQQIFWFSIVAGAQNVSETVETSFFLLVQCFIRVPTHTCSMPSLKSRTYSFVCVCVCVRARVCVYVCMCACVTVYCPDSHCIIFTTNAPFSRFFDTSSRYAVSSWLGIERCEYFNVRSHSELIDSLEKVSHLSEFWTFSRNRYILSFIQLFHT